MRVDILPQIVIGALVVAAVVAGLFVVGGPEDGRMEARDQKRMEDLRALSDFIRCVAHANDRQLPVELTPNPGCSQTVRFQDPFSEKAYTYTKTSSDTYQVCATFEKPALLSGASFRDGVLEPSTGCATITYR